MDSRTLFHDQILKDVLPFAIESVSKKLDVDINSIIIPDHLTKESMYIIYKRYIELLISKPIQTSLMLLDINRATLFDFSLPIGDNLDDFIKRMNKLRKKNYNRSTIGITYLIIKWGFLSIFEDILYLKNCTLPITIPNYFHSFYSIYDNKEVYDAIQNFDDDDIFFDIPISIYVDDKMIFSGELFIEGSSMEGMYLAAYYSQAKVKFMYQDQEIDYHTYIENNQLLIAEDIDNYYVKYTGVLNPELFVVNFHQEMFIEGFNGMSKILGLGLEINDFCDNFP